MCAQERENLRARRKETREREQERERARARRERESERDRERERAHAHTHEREGGGGGERERERSKARRKEVGREGETKINVLRVVAIERVAGQLLDLCAHLPPLAFRILIEITKRQRPRTWKSIHALSTQQHNIA